MFLFVHHYARIISKVVILMHIGERIKNRRNELKWSQRKLSDVMGYNNHTIITKIEAGKVDVPQSRIVKFAEVLGVSVAYLMGWEEIEKKPVESAELHVKILTDSQLMETIEEYFLLSEENQKMVRDLIRNLQKKES